MLKDSGKSEIVILIFAALIFVCIASTIVSLKWPQKSSDPVVRRLQLTQPKYSEAMKKYVWYGREVVRANKQIAYIVADRDASARIAAEAAYNLGLINEKRIDLVGARRYYQEAIKLNPKHKRAKEALDKLEAQEYERANSRSTHLAPKCAVDAKKEAERFYDLASYKEDRYRYKERRYDLEEARRYYQEAIKLNPKHKRAKEALDKLEAQLK